MRTPQPHAFSSPYFLVKLVTAVGDGSFTWDEWWLDATNAYTQKVAGRFGDTLNPGWPVDGFTPSVGDLVLCRSADGAGGLVWELVSAVGTGGSGTGLSDQVELGSDYTITSDNTYEEIPAFSLTIPADGDYIIWAEAIASAAVSATVGAGSAASGIGFAFMVNGSVVFPYGAPIVNAPTDGVTFDASGFMERKGTFSAGDVLTMAAIRVPGVSSPFSVSVIDSIWRGTLGATRMGYFQTGGSGGGGGTGVFATVSPNYSITTDDTWEDTGLTLSVPSAGDYLLMFSSNAYGQVSALGVSVTTALETRFYDVTNAVALNASVTFCNICQVVNRAVLQNFVMQVKYTAAGPATIRVEAFRIGFGNTWTLSIIGNGTNLGSIGYFPL